MKKRKQTDIEKISRIIPDKYILGSVLGKGGNAVVYDVTDKETGNQYALKYLKERSEEKKERFKSEIEILLQIKAESIQGVVDIIDSSKDDFWYVMPKLNNAMEYLKTHTDYTLERIISLFITLLKTLISTHEKKIYHRDIKPDNIYIDDDAMILGDFGLVDFPDRVENITAPKRPLGAIFTIAPEMKRNPTTADGEKADVYSIAKTLWMFLLLDEKGFDGQYNFLDKTIHLRKSERYQDEHLVEIEELLTRATSNDPKERPTMCEFLEGLKNWENVSSNLELSQISDWNFITKMIFGNFEPKNVLFDELKDIRNILSIISYSPAFNHMFFSDGGGSDLKRIEQTNECGCISLIVEPHEILILKPKRLYYYAFPDIRWNCFLLELDDLEPAVGDRACPIREEVVEDYPGHYVSDKDAIYGVYDYDSGKKLPKTSRRVTRCIHEKLLFTMKMGPYNYISSTYDGRHGRCNANEFYQYISYLSSILDFFQKKTGSEGDALHLLSHFPCPFPKKEISNISTRNETLFDNAPFALDYVKKHYTQWNFSDYLPGNKITNNTARFYFVLKNRVTGGNLSEIFMPQSNLIQSSDKNALFVMKDGSIQELICKKDNVLASDAFYLEDYMEIPNIIRNLNSKLKQICKGYSLRTLDNKIEISIYSYRIANPPHLFTKEELTNAMRAADDRVSTRIVVDVDGNVSVIPGNEPTFLYPVFNEIFCSRNNYVGKYAPLTQIDDLYCALLDAWLQYLKTGRYQSVGDYLSINDEDELRKQLKVFYPHQK